MIAAGNLKVRAATDPPEFSRPGALSVTKIINRAIALSVFSAVNVSPANAQDMSNGTDKLYVAVACVTSQQAASGSPATSTPASEAAHGEESFRMWMTIGDESFAITLAHNVTARSFAELLPLTMSMSDLNKNEKHARLPAPLPVDARRPGTIQNGDIMLYGTDTLVVFYRTFESPYSYTHIGRLDDPAALAQALGRGDVRITFSRD